MEFKEFKKFVDLAKKSGITELKIGDMEFKLNHDVLKRRNMQEEPSERLSPEETLLWSATGGEAGMI